VLPTIKQDKIIPVGTLKSIEKQANLVLVESRVYLSSARRPSL
jgi:small nuclear ribonucleoprotein (snRNP)-like protein